MFAKRRLEDRHSNRFSQILVGAFSFICKAGCFRIHWHLQYWWLPFSCLHQFTRQMWKLEVEKGKFFFLLFFLPPFLGLGRNAALYAAVMPCCILWNANCKFNLFRTNASVPAALHISCAYFYSINNCFLGYVFCAISNPYLPPLPISTPYSYNTPYLALCWFAHTFSCLMSSLIRLLIAANL